MEEKGEPRNNPQHLYSQLILDRGRKHIHLTKIVYSINGVGKIGQIRAEK